MNTRVETKLFAIFALDIRFFSVRAGETGTVARYRKNTARETPAELQGVRAVIVGLV
jgi:hypothetical protein